jgi:hypothetical protein
MLNNYAVQPSPACRFFGVFPSVEFLSIDERTPQNGPVPYKNNVFLKSILPLARNRPAGQLLGGKILGENLGGRYGRALPEIYIP